MGERGAPPLPTEVKLRRGTLKPCRSLGSEPTPPKLEDFTPPVWICEVAQAKYKVLAWQLSDAGVIKITDTDILAMYCETFALVLELTETSRDTPRTITTPNGHEQSHPIHTQLRDAQTHLIKLTRELGLSPSARTRVQASEPARKVGLLS